MRTPIVVCALAAMAVGCSGPHEPEASTVGGEGFSVGGVVSGLSGMLVLRDNGADDLTLSANGAFTFPTRLSSGSAYDVTVTIQPAGQTCIVSSGSGTVGSANVTAVQVACRVGYPIGGTVSGLVGVGCVLQNNGIDPLEVADSGEFTFPTFLSAGSRYSATVRTQPRSPGQTCTVSDGSGTVSGPVTSIRVACSVDRPPCSSAVDLGSVAGDQGADLLTASGTGDAWYRVHITEESTTYPDIIGAWITLSVPSGIAYEVYVYCFACGGEVGGVADAAGAPGTTMVGWDDRFILNDDGDILIWVRYSAGRSAGNWTLRVRGHYDDTFGNVWRATCSK